MKEDLRMLFVIKSLHCVVDAENSLDTEEVDGLKQILESIVIDGRDKA